MLTASSDGADPHPVWSCRMLREAFQPCQQDGSNKHSNLESSIALLGNLLCLVGGIFSCLRMNAALPHRTCEQSLETRGSWKAPRLQLLDLREEGIFFLPVPSPAEGGCVVVHC